MVVPSTEARATILTLVVSRTGRKSDSPQNCCTVDDDKPSQSACYSLTAFSRPCLPRCWAIASETGNTSCDTTITAYIGCSKIWRSFLHSLKYHASRLLLRGTRPGIRIYCLHLIVKSHPLRIIQTRRRQLPTFMRHDTEQSCGRGDACQTSKLEKFNWHF